MVGFVGFLRRSRALLLALSALIAGVLVLVIASGSEARAAGDGLPGDAEVTFGAIGDWGVQNEGGPAVGALMAQVDPDIVITMGDNRYNGNNFDDVAGGFYCGWLRDAQSGSNCPSGGTASINRFFPATGNHDYTDAGGISEYLNYFTLPGAGVPVENPTGTELYYDFTWGPVHFFTIDSQAFRNSSSSRATQTAWLQSAVESSTKPWQVVFLHHSPFSSAASHGSDPVMQLPYGDWGADLVLSGHDHTYERFDSDTTYVVSGLGGRVVRSFGPTEPDSVIRYAALNGASFFTATATELSGEFRNINNAVIDSFVLQAPAQPTIPGDVDCDGVLTANDPQAIAEYTVGNFTGVNGCPLPNPASQINIDAADVNGDGAISVGDSVIVSQCVNFVSNVLCPQDPFNGPHDVPGIVQAEDFDTGGQGFAYNDTESGNSGTASYRSGESVDIWNTVGEAGFTVGRTRSGEWLEYTVSSATTQTLAISARVASGLAAPGSLAVTVDGAAVDTTAVSGTGGWWTFDSVDLGTHTFDAGDSVVRLEWQGALPKINLDRLEFELVSVPTILGDVNCDGVLTAADALAITQYDVGVLTAFNGCPLDDPAAQINIDVADVNGDGVVGVVDALFIDQCVNGQSNALCPQAAFNGPHNVPGLVQAEDFDSGGQGIAYNDTEPGNSGTASYRSGESVDIWNTVGEAGFTVGRTRDGEWLEFTVSSAATQSLDISARVASGLAAPGSLAVTVDGVDVGTTAVSGTGGWWTFGSVDLGSHTFDAGDSVVRLTWSGALPKINIDRLEFELSAVQQQAPFNGPHNVPGVVQAEDFDLGGQGTAYNDTEPGNSGTSSYRSGESVDVYNTSGEAGLTVGRTRNGEWLEFTVSSAVAQSLDISARVASGLAAPGSLNVTVDGVDVGTTAVSGTGGWWTFDAVDLGTHPFDAGDSVVRLTWSGALPKINLDRLEFDVAVVPVGISLAGEQLGGQAADVAPGPELDAGAELLSFSITNTGGAALTGIATTPASSCTGSLAVGASNICTATVTLVDPPQSPAPILVTSSEGATASGTYHYTIAPQLLPIVLNEIESSGGTPDDWTELFNPNSVAVDIGGYTLSDSNNLYTFPANTLVPANGYRTFERATVGFGYGDPDSSTLRNASGVVIGSYSWSVHAGTSYGRCPDGSGAFTTTTSVTKNAENDCSVIQPVADWPGSSAISVADVANTFGSNLSGLDYEASGGATPGVLWASKNGPGSLYRLTWNGSAWTPDTTNGWSGGKALRYPNGSGDVDAEGVTFANDTTSVFIGSERNNSANGTSRNSVLEFDATASGTTLTASTEWNLTADLPTTAANAGIEAITWISDSVLQAGDFVDEATGASYDPSVYAAHNGGVFFVGLEATGGVYGYVLEDNGGATRVATIDSELDSVMALEYDVDLNVMWAVCDNGCTGRAVTLELSATGAFDVTGTYERPTAMPNINNEGFAVAPVAECVNNERPAVWADDDQTGGNALRQGTITCGPL